MQPQPPAGTKPQSHINRHRTAFAALLLLILAAPTLALAEGREFDAQRYDLQVKVDTRWAGCRVGGYYPVRLRLTNTGPARNITVRFTPPSRAAAQVERTVGLTQNATARFSLPIPVVGPGNYGELALYENGRKLQGMEWTVSLPEVSWNEATRPAFLVVSPKVVDLSALEAAVQAKFAPPVSSGYGYGGRSSAVANDHVILAKEQLPDTWLDYSGLDAAFIPLATLAELPSATRAALLAWVETGGTLVVTDVGGPADESDGLRKALALDQRSETFRRWTAADPEVAKKLPPRETQSSESTGTTVVVEPDAETPPLSGDPVWPRAPETFQSIPLLQGTVFAFPNSPFSGSARDWYWLLNSRPENAWLWHHRHGASARVGHSEFLQHEIPGLKSVPASAFVALITFFALGIGPVNYFLLWRKKRLWMLVVTIPAIAFLTSVLLFAWSTVMHGFGVRSRTRSLTVLDQNSRTAVTAARISLFAGLSPSRGIEFSPETEVTPVWQFDPADVGGVDWTRTHELDSAWLRSRTRTQFATLNHRAERGRLVVGTADGGKLPVENGFSWGIELLVVVDAQGNRFVGENLDAGAGTKLAAVTDAKTQLAPFVDALGRWPLKAPESAAASASMTPYPIRPGRYYPGWNSEHGGRNASFRTTRLETLINDWTASTTSGTSPKFEPKSYLAILKDNPGVEKGVAPVRETAPLHVLLGYY